MRLILTNQFLSLIRCSCNELRGGTAMNIIVHYPNSAELSAELEKRVATVHIDAVTTRINSLSCPKSQKLSLIEKLKEIT